MSEDASLFDIGEIVDDAYEIRSVLGEGGMGRVYGAHDVALSRRVAVKASWPHVDPSLLLKEAQAIASVRHPAMIDVYGAGTHRGITYLVMEFLYGVDLEMFLAKRRSDTTPFEVREVLDVLIQVADALAAVHRSGIAHRDVKPGNIMLTPNGRIVLMDFGLFRPENAGEASLSGTPEYMAPESIRGEVDPRNAFYLDMYALAITAYELLTGDVPFEGPTPQETLSMHARLPVPDVREERPEVPVRLAALMKEMLAKEPFERPPSMEAVVFRLRAIRDALQTPVVAQKFAVLVVDDDPALGKLLGLYAQRAIPDASIEVVDDAEKALVSVRKRPPDAMLLDLHMPRMNGIELCMMLRGTHLADQCTVIAVSAGAREADIDLLRQLGITRFVPKGADLGGRLSPQLRELHEEWLRARGLEKSGPTPMALRQTAPAMPAVQTKMPPAREVKSRAEDVKSDLLRQLAKLEPESRVVLLDRELDRAIAAGGGEIEIAGNGRHFRVKVVPLKDDAGQVGWGMTLIP